MRVVSLVPVYPKLSETFIVSKAAGLLQRGLDVHIVCIASKGSRAAFRKSAFVGFPEHRVHGTRHYGCTVCTLYFSALLFLRLLITSTAMLHRLVTTVTRAYGLTGLLRRFAVDARVLMVMPDVLHFEFGALAADRMYLKEVTRAKTVVSFRGYDINYVGLEQPDHYREVWRHADMLHVLGRDLHVRAMARGCPPDKPFRIIAPAPATRFAKVASVVHDDDARLRILSVGRLEWIKGYEYALRCCAILHSHGVPFDYYIAGDGPLYEALQLSMHQLGLAERVALLGNVEPDAMSGVYRQANVFLHAAVSEGFCNAVIEAQLHGLPVVTTDAGGLVENVIDKVTGFVVSRRNPQALADALTELSKAPRLRATTGAAAAQHVRMWHSHELHIEAFMQMYSTI